ncbi:MAG: clostripain-related cysteine peptidase [Pseudothermotoga sp.]
MRRKKIFLFLTLLCFFVFLASSCATVFNYPPNAPSSPSPANGATDVSPYSLTLSWNCTDPDGDLLTYDLYFGTQSNPPFYKSNLTSSSFYIGNLSQNTTYFWKIVAKDSEGNVKEGPVWSFTTVALSEFTITILPKTMTIGRVNYVNARVLSQNGIPQQNIDVTFQYFDGTWKSLSTVKTNSNGIASQELPYDFKTVEGSTTIRAYITTQPTISTQKDLSFQKPDWVFLIYLAADNDLEQYALADLEEMENDNSQIAVFTLFDGNTTIDKLLALDEFGQWKVMESYSEDINSGDPIVLKDFIQHFSNIPANHRALIIWNHGSAWVYDSSFATKAIGFDDTQYDALAIKEIRQAIEEAAVNFDILGMDACLMASLEVIYELKDLANYLIASFFSEPGSGWNYEFLSEIESLDPEDVGKLIVNKYFESLPYYSPLSLCVYNSAEIQNVVQSVSQFGDKLKVALQSDSSFKSRLLNYRDLSTVGDNTSPYDLLIDLESFATQITQNETDTELVGNADAVISSLQNAAIYNRTSGMDATISIFFPTSSSDWNEYNNDLSTLLFYTDCPGWIEFLQEFVK